MSAAGTREGARCTLSIEPNAFTRFVPVKDGLDRFLIASREQAARNRELFAALCAQPPGR